MVVNAFFETMTIMGSPSSTKDANSPQQWRRMDSPIGPLLLRSHGSQATGVFLKDQQHYPSDAPECDSQAYDESSPDILRHLEVELHEFFSGQRREFQTEIRLIGTDFQKQVWQCLMLIPFGSTTTYGRIAAQLGNPHASRAVGAAIGRNPLSILIPCHRVIGKSGALTGYAGGIDQKRWLLNREQELSSATGLSQGALFS